jgi:hypothetical protein
MSIIGPTQVYTSRRLCTDTLSKPVDSLMTEVIKEHQAEVYLKLQSNDRKTTNRKSKVISITKTWTLYKDKKNVQIGILEDSGLQISNLILRYLFIIILLV